jgi:excisionase family DNA binding protein
MVFLKDYRKYGFFQRVYVILVYIPHGEVKMQEKPFYSPEEVAEYYDVTADTIRRLCREGKIPGAKQIGKQWRIPREYLQSTSNLPKPDEKKDQG